MGASSPEENGYIIWIDKNVNNEENQNFITILKKAKFIIDTYIYVDFGLNEIYNYQNINKNIYVILSGSFYQDFILKVKKGLKDLFVAPKITVFTKDEKLFFKNNYNIRDFFKNKFYILGGIQTLFKSIYEDFLIKKIWKKNYKLENKCLNSDTDGINKFLNILIIK